MANIISKNKVQPHVDPCGLLRELYSSRNISIAHDTVIGEARPHMHNVMEEVYYVTKGRGEVVIGEEVFSIRKGDTIPIPKDTWHYLKPMQNNPLEVLVITHPKYDPNDLILKE